MKLAFPKPKDIRRKHEAVKVFPDGREVCNLNTPGGRAIYEQRIADMWWRQAGKCCLCGRSLSIVHATFEHQDGRGMNGSHRDDRIEKDGKPYNGVAHWCCNNEKGSKRINYNAA